MTARAIAFLLDSVPFTRDVIAGRTSLGGSESACLGLARALKARGHEVHILASKLDSEAEGPDQAGVFWHGIDGLADLMRCVSWDVVVGQRMPWFWAHDPIEARLKVFWAEDLLTLNDSKYVMAVAWAFDRLMYVSDFHRQQWEERLPELKGIAYVSRNGFDPADLPAGPVVKDPTRIIHTSRPERGLDPLLTMWPAVRQARPDATLQICRYNSMYDAGNWGRVCAGFDARVAEVNARVGGITYLGELTKPDLYRAIAEAAVMWYPGVADFAETSCLAAIEAQACGTPFVGSYKGALPETVPNGHLVRGDARRP